MNKILSASLGLTALVASSYAVAAPTTYNIDPNHTSVTTESRHFGTSTIRTHFNARSGTVTIDPAAKTGKADITIDLTSSITGVPKLDAEIHGDKLLGAADATFVAQSFTFDGDKVTQIAGDLTVHGKTGSVTLKSTNYNCYTSPMSKKYTCGGDFEGTMLRSQWDVNYLVPLVSDQTKLLIQIEATKAE